LKLQFAIRVRSVIYRWTSDASISCLLPHLLVIPNSNSTVTVSLCLSFGSGYVRST